MITLTNILNTATTQQYGINIKEHLCKAYDANTVTPAVSVTYSVGNTNLVGSVLFATVYVTTTATYTPRCSGCVATTRTFVESFNVAFTGATAASGVTFTPGTMEVNPAYESNNGTAKGILVNTSVIVTLS